MFKQFCCKGVEASGVGGTRVEQLFCVTFSPLSISFPPYCVSSELLQYTGYEFAPLCDYNYKRVVFFYCRVRTPEGSFRGRSFKILGTRSEEQLWESDCFSD